MSGVLPKIENSDAVTINLQRNQLARDVNNNTSRRTPRPRRQPRLQLSKEGAVLCGTCLFTFLVTAFVAWAIFVFWYHYYSPCCATAWWDAKPTRDACSSLKQFQKAANGN